ncbi:hypothetical protein [Flavobacterium denitrificans]|nr:hypothetical protein [Flavobacterium denitrificans]
MKHNKMRNEKSEEVQIYAFFGERKWKFLKMTFLFIRQFFS